MLINVKMPNIVGILTFMSWIKKFYSLGPGLIKGSLAQSVACQDWTHFHRDWLQNNFNAAHADYIPF